MNSSRFLSRSLVVIAMALLTSHATAQVSISIDVAPPPLVIDDQPVCPDDGYLWTPGYWAYDDGAGEYYWVSGAWVQPPEIGLLWTPPYWGWNGNAYAFNSGYWGSTVGFYGGVNYGHGYWGGGYGGGRWEGGHFDYNSATNNVSRDRVHNVYEDRTAIRKTSTRTSYNGGKGGVTVQPTEQQRQSSQQSHVQATAQQQTHFQTAAQQRSHQVKVKANPNKPTASGATQPQVNQQNSQPFTGGNSETQKVDPSAERKTTPAQTEPKPSFNNQVKPEEKTDRAIQNPAPESHPPSAPMEAKPHDKETFSPSGGGANHPETQSKPEAKPQSKPQEKPAPKAEGQGKPGGQGKPDAQQQH